MKIIRFNLNSTDRFRDNFGPIAYSGALTDNNWIPLWYSLLKRDFHFPQHKKPGEPWDGFARCIVL